MIIKMLMRFFLRYEAFAGNISFVIDNCDLSMHWGWVPVFDFVICLYEVLYELKSGKPRSIIDFTESEEELLFEIKNDNIEVSASYSHCKGMIRSDEFFAKGITFIKKVFSDFERDFIGLSDNYIFKKIQKDVFALRINFLSVLYGHPSINVL